MVTNASAAPRAICYLRVSTEEQVQSGAGLDAQRAAVLAEVERRGWQLVEVIEDAGYSAKSLDRPGIQRALPMLEGRGRVADVLVVAKLDRLSRSVHDASRRPGYQTGAGPSPSLGFRDRGTF